VQHSIGLESHDASKVTKS